MEVPPANPGNKVMEAKNFISLYSSQLWNRFASFLAFRDSSILAKVYNLYLQQFRIRSRKRKFRLPIPVVSESTEHFVVIRKASAVFDVLEDTLEHILSGLHGIQKNLLFWHSRAEGSDAQKVYFMVVERGPWAFVDGTLQMLHGCVTNGSPMGQLCNSAAAQISERIAVLSSLRCALAVFLAQIYIEIDKFGEDLIKDPEKSLSSLLVTLNRLFSRLETSIGELNGTCQNDSSVSPDGRKLFTLKFEKLPEIIQEGCPWTDCAVSDAINLIHQNLLKLDSYLSLLVARYQKPRKVTLYWFRYTFGAVGLSYCSLWLLRHSSLMGSSDIDNWIREAKDSVIGFWNDHVEQPLLSIRDELFETFRKRHKGMMEPKDVQLTAESLHRILRTFSEQTKGQIPEDASDQEMLEIVMARYEKELMHPIQNLLGGELARAMLIQIQKLKLDMEMGMLELDQILRANEINFAILAALPAFFLFLILIMLVRAWLKQDKGAEGRGRVARIQRRLLIVEVERRIMQFQTFLDQGLEEDAHCMYGLVLYYLDRLLRAVERHANATGEWLSLRQDILDLAKPGMQTAYKLTITSRLDRLYDCLMPASKRQ